MIEPQMIRDTDELLVFSFDGKQQHKMIEKFGVDRQSLIAMEECAELQQAISKMARFGDTDGVESTYLEYIRRKANLIEEIGDVLICLYQLMHNYKIHCRDVQESINRKEKRDSERYEL